jgi:hypothetical protein
VSDRLHDPAALPPGKETLVPLDTRMGGLQSRSGQGGENKNSQPLPVAQRCTTELSRLSFRRAQFNKCKNNIKNIDVGTI